MPAPVDDGARGVCSFGQCCNGGHSSHTRSLSFCRQGTAVAGETAETGSRRCHRWFVSYCVNLSPFLAVILDKTSAFLLPLLHSFFPQYHFPVILKYKTHTDPEFKVNRKGVLKHIYGPSAITEESSSQSPLHNNCSPSSSSSNPCATVSSSSFAPNPSLQAVAPSRPAPLRIPSHPVVVDWHHLHDQLGHVKTSWLETAAYAHNPFIVTTPAVSIESADGGHLQQQQQQQISLENLTLSLTKTSSSKVTPPLQGVISGSLALFAITRLDVSENGITQLPLALFQLNSLKLLNLGLETRM